MIVMVVGDDYWMVILGFFFGYLFCIGVVVIGGCVIVGCVSLKVGKLFFLLDYV